MAPAAWLMKAEPETRIEKGKDVAFSALHFEKAGVEHWDGVRNHEAKNIMKDKMKVGDKVLFYHSNCKVPGVAALAEIHKEGYPDFTAWDPDHPYYDPKSSRDSPTWYMVDVKFISHLPHFVPLKLLQTLASAPYSSLPSSVTSYLSSEDVSAIKSMPLLNRGRLSVQPVDPQAYEAIRKLGKGGGWEEMPQLQAKGKAKRKTDDAGGLAEVPAEGQREAKNDGEAGSKPKPKSRKRVQQGGEPEDSGALPAVGARRSKRTRS